LTEINAAHFPFHFTKWHPCCAGRRFERVDKHHLCGSSRAIDSAANIPPQYKYRGSNQRHSFGALLHELFIAAEIGKSARDPRLEMRGPNLQNVLAFESRFSSIAPFSSFTTIAASSMSIRPRFCGTAAYPHPVL
jgi:hypothetical protein